MAVRIQEDRVMRFQSFGFDRSPSSSSFGPDGQDEILPAIFLGPDALSMDGGAATLSGAATPFLPDWEAVGVL